MYKKILVPLDGSKLSEKALDHLKAIVDVKKVEKVIIMMVIEPILADIKSYIDAERIHETEVKREEEARKYLKKIADSLKKEGVPVEIKLEADGDPSEKILDVSKEENIDLIIMSTHGRTGFKRWLHGSVASRIIGHSAVPILIVVPEEKKKYQW